MLMHRAAIGFLRAVAAHVRWARFFQGEAAGGGMAVPVNWRAFDVFGVDWEARSDDARCSLFSPMRLKHGKQAGELPTPGTQHGIVFAMTQSDLDLIYMSLTLLSPSI